MSKATHALASSSQLATSAGRDIALSGGNAVDAGVAAALVTLITEPGVVALGGGGYITLSGPDIPAITLDGYMAVPGLGSGHIPGPEQMRPVSMEYGGGVTTLVGYASVCTPGALKALEHAVIGYGQLSWSDVVQPAIQVARQGFPLSQACHNYLIYSHKDIFGVCQASADALQDKHGNLLNVGDRVFVEHLADSLGLIAQAGTDAFYRGELAQLIVSDMRQNQGSLDASDLANYEVVARPALTFSSMGWSIATNPPPAVGGATMAALVLAMQTEDHNTWDASMLRQLLNAQEYVLDFRRRRLDRASQIEPEIDQLLKTAGNLQQAMGSPSTVHTSSVDKEGFACGITLSAGYGSGIISNNTGIWMNNSLGELELNRKHASTLIPGQRMLSNMAPTVASHDDGTVLSIGSPGADRITTAIAQTLVGYLGLGLSLQEAVAHPRVHLEWADDKPRFAYEPGLELPQTPHATRAADSLSMYFGGVGVVSCDSNQTLTATSDPRRVGSAIVVEQ